MDVTLREAAPEDVPALEIVRRQAIEHGFTGEYDRGDVADLVATADADLPGHVDAADRLVIVAESEVTILAYGVYDRETGRVLGLYTAPAYEREGWATRILERFEERARGAGLDALAATVPHNARAFFRANGFEAVGETTRDGRTLLEMRKPLR